MLRKRSLRVLSTTSAVSALTCLSLLVGAGPVLAGPPTPEPKAGPAEPATKALAQPKVKPNDPKLVGSLVPAEDSLVDGRLLQVRIPVQPGAKLDVARLDLRPINRYLRLRGSAYVGRVPNVPAGLAHLNVTVVKGKAEARSQSRFVVRGKRANLLSPLSSTSGKLAAAQAPGVAPVAVTAHPRATMFATVNGRRVDDDHLGRPEMGNARRFVVSLDDGLRPGRNMVATTAYLPDGQWETIRRLVTVPAGNPMAEAGVTGQRREGATLRLDGSRSAASIKTQKLSYSWRLIAAPSGAKPIAAPTARTTSLNLTQPGDYVVGLTVTETVAGKRRTSTDLATVSSVNTEPAIGARLETLVTNTDKLPPAKQGASTDGIGLVFDGEFRSFAVDFPDTNGGLAPAGLYRINPQSLEVVPVPLIGTDLDGAVSSALGQAVQGEIIVLQVRSDAKITSKYMASGPYSRVVAYDGQGTNNFWSGGSTNAGLQLRTSAKDLGPAGSLSGYLRVVVDSTQAETGFRFVRDSGRLSYSTNVPRTATTRPDGGAIYRLVSTASGKAVTSAPGDPIVQVVEPGTDLGQQWQLVAVYGGLFKLVDQATGRCLTTDLPTSDGVFAQECDGREADQADQLWSPQYDTVRRAYRFVSASAPNDYIGRGGSDQTGYLTAEQGSMRLDSSGDQYWFLDIPPGVYTLRVGSGSNSQAGKALAEPDYGTSGDTQLRVTADTGELTQRWQVVDGPRAAGQPQQFSLVNLASGLCADVPGGDKQDNGHVNRYTCHPTGGDQANGNQQWTPIATPNGLELHSVATGEALAVDTNGNVVQQQLDAQAPVKQVWSLRRAAQPVLNNPSTLSLGDRSARSLMLSGPNLSAAKTSAPAAGNTWTLVDQGNGQVQIRNADGQTCIDPYAGGNENGDPVPQPRPCSSSGFAWQQASDGTWRFSTGDGALVVAVDGTLAMKKGVAGTPFLPAGFDGTLQVGRQSYRLSAAAGQSGFWVVAFDQALQPLSGYPRTFVTSGPQVSGARDLAAALNTLGKVDHSTVLVQSFGRPKPTDGSWNDLRTALDQLGVDGRSVLQLDGTGDFAAAGCVGCSDAPDDNEVTDRTGSEPRGGARLTGQLGWTATSTRVPTTGTTATMQQGLSALADRDGAQTWPFPTGDQRSAVDAIYETLSSWPDACHDPNADSMRNTYCAQDAATWASRTVQLDNVTYAQARANAKNGDTFDQATFNLVKHGLLREFNQVQQVHGLFADVTGLLETNFIDAQATLGPNSAASRINDTIYAPKGPTPTTPSNPWNAGGVLTVIGDGMIVLKDLVEVGGIIIADQPNDPVGTDPKPEPDKPSMPGSGFSLLADGFLLTADVVDLAGSSDDASPNLGLDIVTPLHDYANQVNTQLVGTIDNIDTVRDIILGDPITLATAAMNRGNGPWQLSTDQQTTIKKAFTSGIVRDLWPRQLGAGFQLLRWPKLPVGFGIGDIRAPYDNSSGFHQLYDGQPDGASVRPVEKVGDNGAATSRGTYVLTRLVPGSLGNDSLAEDVDRIVRPSILNPFYANTGITRYDLPALTPLRNPSCAGADDWPFWPGSFSNLTGTQQPGGKFTYFGSDAKDWDSEVCTKYQ